MKSRKVKKSSKHNQITAKRLAASTLEHENDFDSSLFKSFHRKTPISRHLEFKDMRGKSKKKNSKLKCNVSLKFMRYFIIETT